MLGKMADLENSEPALYEVKSSLSLCFCQSKLSFGVHFEAIETVLSIYLFTFFFFFSLVLHM